MGHPASRVRSLGTKEGREQLQLAVWGPPGLAATQPGSSSQRGSGFWDGWGWWPDDDGLLVIVAVVAVVLWLAGGWALSLWRRWRYDRALAGPFGAPCEAAPTAARGPVGVVQLAPALACEPLTKRLCVAYSALFTFGRTKEVMLRDSVTTGFDLVMASGERLRVPAGVLLIEDRAALRRRSSASVSVCVPEVPSVGRARELFPHDAFELTVLAPGDRVEVLSGVRRAGADPSSVVTYRESPEVLYECESPVRLRRVAANA